MVLTEAAAVPDGPSARRCFLDLYNRCFPSSLHSACNSAQPTHAGSHVSFQISSRARTLKRAAQLVETGREPAVHAATMRCDPEARACRAPRTFIDFVDISFGSGPPLLTAYQAREADLALPLAAICALIVNVARPYVWVAWPVGEAQLRSLFRIRSLPLVHLPLNCGIDEHEVHDAHIAGLPHISTGGVKGGLMSARAVTSASRRYQ